MPLMMICPRKLPGVNCAVFTLIVTWPDCPGAMLPPDGEAASQTNDGNGVTTVCQLRALFPLLVIVTTWPEGLDCPWMLLKLRLSGETPIIGDTSGGAACTVSCTVTVSVLFPVTKKILPEYFPDISLFVLTLISTRVLAVPFNCLLVGEVVNQDAVDEVFQ